jgi:hypothetical protein
MRPWFSLQSPSEGAPRAPVLAPLLAAFFICEHALAAPATEALANCRLTIGRPVVRACVHEHLLAQGGLPSQYIAACKVRATPAVKGCFQSAMADVIADCRQSIGKPIVQACVKQRISAEGQFRIEFVEGCRKSAIPAVKACVWQTSAQIQ